MLIFKIPKDKGINYKGLKVAVEITTTTSVLFISVCTPSGEL